MSNEENADKPLERISLTKRIGRKRSLFACNLVAFNFSFSALCMQAQKCEWYSQLRLAAVQAKISAADVVARSQSFLPAC
jgi:hypothetical protein